MGDSRLAAYAAERVEIARRMAEVMRAGAGGGLPRQGLHRDRGPAGAGAAADGGGGHPARRRLPQGDVGRAGRARSPGWRRRSTSRRASEFNLNSPQQLGVILFEKMGLPVLKKTQKTKSYSTGAETLEELAARGYPIAAAPAALPRADQAQVDLRRRPAGAGRRRTGASTPASTRRWRPPAGSPRPTRTCRTSPSAPSSGQRIRRAFVAPPGQRPAGRRLQPDRAAHPRPHRRTRRR